MISKFSYRLHSKKIKPQIEFSFSKISTQCSYYFENLAENKVINISGFLIVFNVVYLNHIILNRENSFRTKLYVICRSFCNTPICKIGNAAHRYYFLYIVGMYVYHFLWNSSQCSAEYISIEEQQKKLGESTIELESQLQMDKTWLLGIFVSERIELTEFFLSFEILF